MKSIGREYSEEIGCSKASGSETRTSKLNLPKGCTENLMKNIGIEYREEVWCSMATGCDTQTPKLIKRLKLAKNNRNETLIMI